MKGCAARKARGDLRTLQNEDVGAEVKREAHTVEAAVQVYTLSPLSLLHLSSVYTESNTEKNRLQKYRIRG